MFFFFNFCLDFNVAFAQNQNSADQLAQAERPMFTLTTFCPDIPQRGSRPFLMTKGQKVKSDTNDSSDPCL